MGMCEGNSEPLRDIVVRTKLSTLKLKHKAISRFLVSGLPPGKGRYFTYGSHWAFLKNILDTIPNVVLLG
jgi:hypothetical protein